MAGEDEGEVVVHIDPALIGADPSLAVVEKPKDEKEPIVKIDDKRSNAEDPVESLKGQLSTLQTRTEETARQRDEALRREQEANQRAADATRQATEARTEVVETQYDTVVSGITAAESEATSAEEAYQQAFSSGDAVAATKAQRRMSEAVSKLGRLQEAKADLETVAKRKEPPVGGDQRTTQTQPQTRTQQGDPSEAFLATRTPKTQQWLRDHPDMLTAVSLRFVGKATTEQNKIGAKLSAASSDAEAEGLTPDTPEYFAHIEKFVGLKKADTRQTTTTRRPAAPTTPVSYSAGGTNGGGVEVRLSAAEAKAANDGTVVWNTPDPSGQNRWKKGDPVGTQEFARRKLAMQKEGRYDRAYLES